MYACVCVCECLCIVLLGVSIAATSFRFRGFPWAGSAIAEVPYVCVGGLLEKVAHSRYLREIWTSLDKCHNCHWLLNNCFAVFSYYYVRTPVLVLTAFLATTTLVYCDIVLYRHFVSYNHVHKYIFLLFSSEIHAINRICVRFWSVNVPNTCKRGLLLLSTRRTALFHVFFAFADFR